MKTKATSQLGRREFLTRLGGAALAVHAATAVSREGAGAADPHTGERQCDVFVLGSTPAGIAAGLEAARRGCKVILACPQKHAGGMAASGLCTTDAVRRHLFGGIVLEFVSRVRAHYVRTLGAGSPDFRLIRDGWFYEPSVAERVFDQMLSEQESRLEFLRGRHLAKAEVRAGRIVSITLETESGKVERVTAHTFIDGTYEGDLAAGAGVPFRVGREGRAEHGESRA